MKTGRYRWSNRATACSLVELTPAQHFTKPPARFSEASLVKELEKRGIGRPSTYAFDHLDHSGSRLRAGGKPSFLRGENGRNRHRSAGRKLPRSDELRLHRADGRSCLDQVANHQAEWKEVLNHFFGDFTTQLETAEKDPEEGGMQPNPMVLTSIDCPTCGRKMGIRTASTGVFLGCSGYALPPKERCKTTINLVPENGSPQRAGRR